MVQATRQVKRMICPAGHDRVGSSERTGHYTCRSLVNAWEVRGITAGLQAILGGQLKIVLLRSPAAQSGNAADEIGTVDPAYFLFALLLREGKDHLLRQQCPASVEQLLSQFKADRMKGMIIMKTIDSAGGIVNP